MQYRFLSAEQVEDLTGIVDDDDFVRLTVGNIALTKSYLDEPHDKHHSRRTKAEIEKLQVAIDGLSHFSRQAIGIRYALTRRVSDVLTGHRAADDPVDWPLDRPINLMREATEGEIGAARSPRQGMAYRAAGLFIDNDLNIEYTGAFPVYLEILSEAVSPEFSRKEEDIKSLIQSVKKEITINPPHMPQALMFNNFSNRDLSVTRWRKKNEIKSS